MNSFLQKYAVEVGDVKETAFSNAGDIFQDGTTPMCRDASGKLWAISGHSHMGHIGMFCGTCLDDLKEVYPIQTLFCVGNAEYAFSGIRYPEGVRARGSVWPFGLYICPGTNRFFCFFHNESGWEGVGTAYDALGPCERPHYDSDFRHIGLMHSDDEGRTWVFDRWVLTGEEVCFTQIYDPGAGRVRGQAPGRISLGSGDFSLYAEPEGDYIYLIYNKIYINTKTAAWEDCDVYMARTRKRDDGIMGDFVKYYEGSFCEPGNFGKETPVARHSWHARIAYLQKYGKYLMTSCPMRPSGDVAEVIEDVLELRESDDMLHWSEPLRVVKDGNEFGAHYVALFPNGSTGSPFLIPDDDFSVLTNYNGTSVLRWPAKFVCKK